MPSAAEKAWATRRAKATGTPAPAKKIKVAPQEPIVMPKKPTPATVEEMMMRTIVLLVTVNGIGNYRKVDPDSINITDATTNKDVDKSWFGTHRKLMRAPELKKIQSICNKAKAFIFKLALPFSLKSGIYLLPVEFQEELNTKLLEFQAELQPHIEGLAKRLPQYKQEAKSEQGKQFKDDDFPTAAKIRNAFRITWRFLFIDSAKGLTKELYEQERKKAEEEWGETRELVQQMLRAQMAEMVNHLVDKLTPTPDGLRKIFKKGSIDNLNQFLTTFDARNITNDAQLKVLTDKARNLIKDVDPEVLRTNQEVCAYTLHGFETIKLLLDPMIINKPRRAIELE